MSDFTPAIAWSGKDALSDGDANKIVSGADFDTEFSGVQTAVNSKYDSTDLGVTLQGYDADTAKTDVANTWTKVQTMNSKQVQLAKGADIVSGTALPLLTDGNYFDVTGTTTITSIDSSGVVGTVVKLHFDAALTLTHHATDLILPGAANITTAAGDEAEFVEYASGDFRCTSYTKADGTSLVSSGGGGWEFVSAVTASSSATVSFTGMETGYDYLVEGYGITPATDSVELKALLGITGPTYRTTLYDMMGGTFSTSGLGPSFGAKTTHIPLSYTNQGNVLDESIAFRLELKDPAGAADTYVFGNGVYTDASGNRLVDLVGGHYTTAEAHTAFQLAFSSGNIAIGTFKLYRRANA